MHKRRKLVIALLLPLMLLVVGPMVMVPPAQAAFPGANGKLVFHSAPDGGTFDIYTINPDGSGLTQLTTSGTERFPVWSPDGSKIAFNSFRDGNAEIYVMNADGSGQTNVTNSPGQDEFPDWQPLPAANTPLGDDVTVSPSSGTNITFSTVFAAGNTSVTTSTSAPAVPAGFSLGTSPTYYDISTTAGYNPPVTVCITYDPTQYSDPNNVRLLHYENNAWADVTTSNDIINHIVCGQVSSLSPFVVAQSKYHFSGFFQPVDNLPTLNVTKAGSAIPVKFSLGGNQGLNIFESGYPKSQRIPCDATTPVDGIEETVTAGASSLAYDAGTDQYIYVWKTDKVWAGTCRQLVVRLNDLSYHRATFKFTK